MNRITDYQDGKLSQVFVIGLPKCREAHYLKIAGKGHNKKHAELYALYIRFLASLAN